MFPYEVEAISRTVFEDRVREARRRRLAREVEQDTSPSSGRPSVDAPSGRSRIWSLVHLPTSTADRTAPTMSTQAAPLPDSLHDALRTELLRLARLEDEVASREAACVHYWEHTPVTVVVHRQCAVALRDAAEELLPH